jgi:hypothetical protein
VSIDAETHCQQKKEEKSFFLFGNINSSKMASKNRKFYRLTVNVNLRKIESLVSRPANSYSKSLLLHPEGTFLRSNPGNTNSRIDEESENIQQASNNCNLKSELRNNSQPAAKSSSLLKNQAAPSNNLFKLAMPRMHNHQRLIMT